MQRNVVLFVTEVCHICCLSYVLYGINTLTVRDIYGCTSFNTLRTRGMS